MATVRVADIALPESIQFSNSKIGEEWYTTRPLSTYANQVRQWAYGFMTTVRKQVDMLVWQAGEAGLELGMAECLWGTANGSARWHTLCLGGAGACWARKPDLAFFMWWGRW